MPPKSPGTSYTGKPVRRLKLPKIGQAKTKSLFEEYFYALLAVVFFSVAILGKAGGFSTYNAVVVAAWITGILWFAKQWKGYLSEKSDDQKTVPTPTPAQAPKRPLPLPAGMKPMIGPQWPVKPGTSPVWPKLPKQKPTTTPQTSASGGPTSGAQVVPMPAAPSTPKETREETHEEKRRFIYERPTLPDRAPKLPNNWAKSDNKKPSNKKPKR